MDHITIHAADNTSDHCMQDPLAHYSGGSANKPTYAKQVLRTKLVTRTNKHISTFLKLRVRVPHPPTPQVLTSFHVTVDSTRTIEHLAALIEAEFAFLYTRLNPLLTTVPYDPLTVGLLVSESGRELHFHELIRDVLHLGDLVLVLDEMQSISQFLDSNPNAFINVAPPMTEDLENDSKFDVHPHPSILSLDHQTYPTYGASHLRTDDDPRSECQQLECLLFWIEVQVFKSTSPELKWLMAKYILFMYMTDYAPLAVNLSSELRLEIAQNITSNNFDHNQISVFDEAQLLSFCILKKQIFPNFEVSDNFKEFLRFRSSDPQAYYTAKIKGKFSSHFKSNLELMLEVTGGASMFLNKKLPIYVKDKYLNRVIRTYVPTCPTIENYWSPFQFSKGPSDHLRALKMQKVRKLTRFFGVNENRDAHNQLKDMMVRQHAGDCSAFDHVPNRDFHDTDRTTATSSSSDGDALTPSPTEVDDLFSRKRRNDKLSDFFGKRVELDSLENSNSDLPPSALQLSSSGGGGQRGGLLAGIASKDFGNTDEFSGLVSKIPFGGGDQCSESTPARVVTTNELSSETKAILTRRSKKLRSVLGEAIDENTAYDTFLKEAFSSSNPFNVPLLDRRPSQVKTLELNTGKYLESKHESDDHLSVDPFWADDVEYNETDLLSITSGESDQDSESGVESAESSMNSIHTSRLRNVQRRGKLQQLLGESKLPDPIKRESSPPKEKLSKREKRAQQRKRASKLEKVFGEMPPGQMSDSERRTLEHRRSIVSISRMLMDPNTLTRVVRHLVLDQDETGGESQTMSRRSSLAFSSSEDDQESEGVQRKRKFDKLSKFFGDHVNVELLIEQNIIRKLELDIEADMADGDERSIDQLREDFALLREQVKEVVSTLPRTPPSGSVTQPGAASFVNEGSGPLNT